MKMVRLAYSRLWKGEDGARRNVESWACARRDTFWAGDRGCLI